MVTLVVVVRCSVEEEKRGLNGAERPLNLSTKPKSKGIWSPASLCEQESKSSPQSATAAELDVEDSSSSPSESPGSPETTTSAATRHHHDQAEQAASFSAALMRTSASLFRPFDPFYTAMRTAGWNAALHLPGNQHHHQHHQHHLDGHGHHGGGRGGEPESEPESSDGDKTDAGAAAAPQPPLPTCVRCDKSFANAQSLELHTRQAHLRDQAESSHPCPRCPKIFEHSCQLEQHLASHHPIRSFQVSDSRFDLLALRLSYLLLRPTAEMLLLLLRTAYLTRGPFLFRWPTTVQTVRQNVQTLVDAVDALADPLGHAALPVPVLRQAFPPKVRHEEAHLHPHRSVPLGHSAESCFVFL